MQPFRKAKRADKKKVIEILSNSFERDLHIGWYTGNDHRKHRKMKSLMAFMFESSFRYKDAYIGNDMKAVALWKNSPGNKMTFRLLVEYIRFTWIFGFSKIKAISKLEKLIHQRHPQTEDYFFLWIIGTHQDHQQKGIGSSLLAPMLEAANQQQKAIYLETTNEENIPFYKKRGFEVHDEVEIESPTRMRIYFMRRLPK